jgi:hypothetical protein
MPADTSQTKLNLTQEVDLEIASAEFLAANPELHHYTTRTGLNGIVTSRTIRA